MGLVTPLQDPLTIAVSIKHGLRTTGCGLGIKHGLGIKCELRTTLVKTVLIGYR